MPQAAAASPITRAVPHAGICWAHPSIKSSRIQASGGQTAGPGQPLWLQTQLVGPHHSLQAWLLMQLWLDACASERCQAVQLCSLTEDVCFGRMPPSLGMFVGMAVLLRGDSCGVDACGPAGGTPLSAAVCSAGPAVCMNTATMEKKGVQAAVAQTPRPAARGTPH